MEKFTNWPATSNLRVTEEPVTQEPVVCIDEKATIDEKGRRHHTLRLSLDPWDLKRLIEAANKIGLNGEKVDGFSFSRLGQNIYISRRSGPASSPKAEPKV